MDRAFEIASILLKRSPLTLVLQYVRHCSITTLHITYEPETGSYHAMWMDTLPWVLLLAHPDGALPFPQYVKWDSREDMMTCADDDLIDPDDSKLYSISLQTHEGGVVYHKVSSRRGCSNVVK
jgi:hypothetical protein